MAGGFDPIDREQCDRYAGFASHLDRRSFDFIYWFLFALVIGMLFLSSWKYSGDLESIRVRDLEPGSKGYRNMMKRCMAVCSICAALSVVAVVMEVYALMALQFCDGEDLMPLYWSTWTMIQAGSVIAIFGIMLAIFNNLRGNKNPPWALALGTPVLVVAGIGHAVHGAMRKRVHRVRSLGRGRTHRRWGVSASASASASNSDPPMSREQTLRADDSEKDEEPEITAKFLGFTPDGAAIIKLPSGEDAKNTMGPDNSVVIGRNNGHVIVALRKAMAAVGTSNGNNEGSSSTAGRRGAGEAAAEPSSKSPTLSCGGVTLPSRPRPPVVRIAPPPGEGSPV